MSAIKDARKAAENSVEITAKLPEHIDAIRHYMGIITMGVLCVCVLASISLIFSISKQMEKDGS